MNKPLSDGWWKRLRAEIEADMPPDFTGQTTIHWHQGKPKFVDWSRRKWLDDKMSHSTEG
jgi:hypothetical protein